MLTLTTEERLALLLSVLGDDASKAAFKSMHPTRATYVKRLLDEFKLDPPSHDEIEYVVKDFNNYFSFAMETLGPQIQQQAKQSKADDSMSSNSKSVSAAQKKPQPTFFDAIEPTGEPADDLNRLDAYQIGKALEDDHPKTVALVLRQLETPLAAAVLENLSENRRTDSVVFLSQESTVPDKIVHQVLVSTFEKANSIHIRETVVDQSQVLAELMRSLPKEMRNQLIERLKLENPDLVDEVRSKLYIFGDLLRLDDRDVQKVLGEIETDILIVALQQADPAVSTKLLNNLSKRARQTIVEEMEYKSGVGMEEIEDARQRLVETLGQLDESGDITLT
jgi:flagellar motor switch protein FliG